MDLHSQEIQPKHPVVKFLDRLERGSGTVVLLILAFLPVAAALVRWLFSETIPYAVAIQSQLVLPLTFIGFALTAKADRHLAISFGLKERKDWIGTASSTVVALVTGVMAGTFFLGSINFILVAFDLADSVWFIPRIVFLIMYPVGLFLVVWRSYPRTGGKLAFSIYFVGLALSVPLGIPAFNSLAQLANNNDIVPWLQVWADAYIPVMELLMGPAVALLIFSAFLGAPLFMVLGGIASFLFATQGDGASVVLSEGYQLMAGGSAVPSIALFTLTGFLLSESNAASRFVRLFKGLFGRMSGGTIIITVVVSAFFTTFTGANGITILALGALLLSILKNSGGNTESFSVGIITSSGAIGLLFPPSLAIIIYGSVAGYSILNLFLAGLLPGLLFVIGMVLVGFFLSRRNRAMLPVATGPVEAPMTSRETWEAFQDSFWELMLPVLIVWLYFSGLMSLVETAAFSAVYALFVETVIKKEVDFRKLLSISAQSLAIIGGVLAILMFARGMSYYFVDIGFPQMLTEWAQTHIGNKWLFLLALNVMLLGVGCLVDIFTAITLLVPLLVPVAQSFGINEAHLAIIFLANLSVGFITPPVGMDLFLASYRFNRPMVKIYKDVFPFILVQIVIVLIITYFDFFTQVLLPKA